MPFLKTFGKGSSRNYGRGLGGAGSLPIVVAPSGASIIRSGNALQWSTPGSYTYTVPNFSGRTMHVIVVGSGGSGSSHGGGGGGGGLAYSTFSTTQVPAGTTLSITIGSGPGNVFSGGDFNGAAGNTSIVSFSVAGVSTMYGYGGGAGIVASNGGQGGSGGGASGGNYGNYSGGQGGSGNGTGYATNSGLYSTGGRGGEGNWPGGGGGAGWCGGGRGYNGGNNGTGYTGYGGGGGYSADGGSNGKGGGGLITLGGTLNTISDVRTGGLGGGGGGGYPNYHGKGGDGVVILDWSPTGLP
jgi:hypothetical protein